MLHRIVRTACAVALGSLLAFAPGLSVADDQETKPEPKSEAKPDAKSPAKDQPAKPDFSKYTHVNDVVGEVVKADAKKLTVRVTWYVPEVKGGNNNHHPQLHQAMPNYRNPYAPNHNRPANTQRVTYKEHQHDYTI